MTTRACAALLFQSMSGLDRKASEVDLVDEQEKLDMCAAIPPPRNQGSIVGGGVRDTVAHTIR
jgi:hypothetical protein